MKTLMTFATLFMVVFSSFSQEASALKVKVENIKKVKGSMMIAIYNHEDQFLSKEIMSDGKAIEKNTIEFTFNGLKAGTYAISIYQDENGNGKLDANFMGIPLEPYAFSNNFRPIFRKPSFEQTKFRFDADRTIQVDLIH